MKLLFDENLSFRLVEAVTESFPGSTHVDRVGLRGATDTDVWRFAAEQGFTVVSKDNDFRQRAFLHGPPPKVVWLVVGNAGTAELRGLVVRHLDTIRAFGKSAEEALLPLGLG